MNLCAWGSEYPAWPRSSWPKPLMKELVARYGSHPLVDQYRLSIRPDSQAEHVAFYEKLVDGLERKGRISLDILQREPWDLALIVFPEVHWAMHLLWQTYDRDHPDHDPSLKLPFDDIFLTLYKKLDALLGRMLEQMPDASVLVFSGSGFGPNYSGWHLLPEVLQRLGVAADPTAPGRSRGGSLLPMKQWGAYRVRKVEDRLSLPVIETLKRFVPRAIWDKGTRRLLHAGNRWSESRAFCLPNDYTGAIRVNLKGREPDGRVAPGAEYEALLDELTRELHALVNPATGRPAVARVMRPAREYPGCRARRFPGPRRRLGERRADHGVAIAGDRHGVGRLPGAPLGRAPRRLFPALERAPRSACRRQSREPARPAADDFPPAGAGRAGALRWPVAGRRHEDGLRCDRRPDARQPEGHGRVPGERRAPRVPVLRDGPRRQPFDRRLDRDRSARASRTCPACGMPRTSASRVGGMPAGPLSSGISSATTFSSSTTTSCCDRIRSRISCARSRRTRKSASSAPRRTRRRRPTRSCRSASGQTSTPATSPTSELPMLPSICPAVTVAPLVTMASGSFGVGPVSALPVRYWALCGQSAEGMVPGMAWA